MLDGCCRGVSKFNETGESEHAQEREEETANVFLQDGWFCNSTEVRLTPEFSIIDISDESHIEIQRERTKSFWFST